MKLTIVDVFAEARYQGNQLAVVENADGLTPDTMQAIAIGVDELPHRTECRSPN